MAIDERRRASDPWIQIDKILPLKPGSPKKLELSLLQKISTIPFFVLGLPLLKSLHLNMLSFFKVVGVSLLVFE